MNAARLVNAAKEDLRKIWSYIARDSELQADQVIGRILQVCDFLAHNSLLGEPWRGQHSRLRFFPVPGNDYVIFFSPVESGAEIVRIVHGHRDLEQEMSAD